MDAVAFEIFGLEIRWYAIMIVLGMLLGMAIAGSLFKKKGMPFDSVVDYAIVVLPLAIIGARLYYMIFSSHSYTFWALFDIFDGVSWWGLLIGLILAAAVGFLAVKINPLKLLKIKPANEGDKLSLQTSQDIALFTVITVLLGLFISRIVHLLFYDAAKNIYELFDIRSGGLAIYGGVILGAVGMLIVAKYKKLSFKKTLTVLDCVAPALLIGQALGRWGNFFNQEAHGAQVTDAAWQFFPYAVKINGLFYQATFFYEFLATLIGCILLYLFVFKGLGKKSGAATCLYFIWYGFFRSIIEGLRTDSLYTEQARHDLRVSQVLSLALMIVFAAAILWLYFKDLSDAEKIAGITAIGIMFLSGLLFIIGQLADDFNYSIYLDSGIKLAAAGLIGLVLYFLAPRKLYLYLGAIFVTAGVLFFAAEGLFSFWVLLIVFVLAAALVAAMEVLNRRKVA